MKTIRVYQLNHLAPMLFHRLKEAQMEAAQVWNCCMEQHKQARRKHTRWPGRNDLQQVTKGRFARDERSRTDGMLDTKTSERNEPPASVNSCGR